MAIDVEALKARADLTAIVGSYVALKKQGAEFKALCPFHADKNPSFYVIPAKGMCHCFGCGWSGDVLDFLQEKEGIDFKTACERIGNGQHWTPKPITQSAPPLPDRITSTPPADAGEPDMETHQLGKPSRVWTYLDAQSRVIGYVARYDVPEGKQIRVWSWGARGSAEPSWGCGQWTKLRPLYGLDRLAERPQVWALVTEGEKACDAATELLPSYACITWPGGANAWKHADWGPLRGRNVLLWPDADAPGAECMARLADLLSGALGCTVKVIDTMAHGDNPLGPVSEGWDAADALAEGWTTDQVIAWAKPRATFYTAVQQNPVPQVALPDAAASQAGNGAPDAPPLASAPPAGAGPPESDAEPPPASDTDFPPGASTDPPRKRRPRLSVVGNNVLAPEEDAEPLPANLSEDALAEHFVNSYGADWRYCTEWGVWIQWKGDGWHRDRRNEVSDLCRAITRQALEWPEAAALTPAAKQKLNRKATAWNARDLAAVDRRITMVPEQLDADLMMLGVPGGVVDLRTGKLLDAERDQYITRRCCCAPQESPHPLFDRVLERACAGNEGMREYLLRWFGYMLTGSVVEEAFMFLHGPGGSGKSTLIKVLSEIAGDYATTISMDALTESPHQRHSQEIAKLEGARLVYASETEEGRRFKESLVKWLTGGDKIVAHRMRMDDREFKPSFKILIYGNTVPHLKSVGEEMRRRIHLIEYAGSLSAEERDTTLKERLVSEYPAILHTLIRGCVDWQECGGLGKPESVSASVDNYLEGEDSLAAFFDECVDRDIAARSLTGDVYRRYRTWATNAGEYVMSQKRLVQALRGRGFERLRSGGMRYISGLKLREQPMTEAPYYAQERS